MFLLDNLSDELCFLVAGLLIDSTLLLSTQ